MVIKGIRVGIALFEVSLRSLSTMPTNIELVISKNRLTYYYYKKISEEFV